MFCDHDKSNISIIRKSSHADMIPDPTESVNCLINGERERERVYFIWVREKWIL